MGRIFVEDLGVVEIEGDEPSQAEAAAINRAIGGSPSIDLSPPENVIGPARGRGAAPSSPVQRPRQQFTGMRPGIETQAGAPAGVRAAVGPPRRKEEDRLATLRKFFPDAQPYGEDNFIFTNPKTGQRQLFNPRGMDVGDVAEYGREVIEFGAGGLGAAAGAAAGPIGAAAGAGLGSEIGGQLYDILQKRFGGMVDTRTLEQMALQAAGNIGAEAVGQGVGDIVASAPGRLNRFVQSNILGRGGAAPARLARLQAAGIPLEGAASAVSQTRPLMLAQEAAGSLPSGARRVNESTEKTLSAVEGKIKDVITRVGGEATEALGEPATKEMAGEMARKAASESAEKFARTTGRLVGELNEQMAGVRVQPSNVTRVLRELEEELAEAPNARQYLRAGIKEGSRLARDLDEAGTVPFKALTDLRTDLWAKLQRPDVSGYLDKQAQAVSKVRAALKDDIVEGATRHGPETGRMRALRDRYISFMRNERIPILTDVEKRKAEDVVDFLMRGTKKGAANIRQFKKTIDKDKYRDFASTALHELGKRGGDDFNTNLFLRNYSRISREAKQELLSGGEMAPLRKELDRLVKIVGDMKQVDEIRNFSKTAMNNYYFQLLGGLGAGGFTYGATQDPGAAGAGFAAAMLSPYAASRLLTSPRFVRWLGTAMQPAGKRMANIGGHLGRLGAIAEAEPRIADEINQLIQAIKQNPPPELQAEGA